MNRLTRGSMDPLAMMIICAICAMLVWAILSNGARQCSVACDGHMLKWAQEIRRNAPQDNTPEQCECRP